MSKVLFKNCKITAIKTVVPNDYIDIDDEIKYFENSEKKLNRAKKIIGYGRRHIVDKNTTSLDLSYEAAESLLTELDINREEIDTLLFVSQTRDYLLPTSANVLHGLLNLSENCAAMDVSQGCSGYVYALWFAHSLIQSGASKKLLLLSSDTISKYSNQDNRLTAPIFGDSASATLLEYTEKECNAYFVLGSKGKGFDKIIIPAGGSRIPVTSDIVDKVVVDENNNHWKNQDIIMSGVDVFNFTMDYAPKSINEVLEFSNYSKEDIGMYALHQANKQIVESVAIKAEIPLEKTPTNTFSDYGNNACNSIAVNLTQNINGLGRGNALLCGFGVGLSWASSIINIDGTKNLGISLYKDTKNTKTVEELKEYWYNRFITKGE